MKISIVGSGNLASHLIPRLQKQGIKIQQLFSRNTITGKALAKKNKLEFISDFSQFNLNVDIVLLCVSDSSIKELVKHFKNFKGILAHTSGTASINDLKQHKGDNGVLYPLQTFSSNVKVEWKEIPVFVEGNSEDAQKSLLKLAKKLSPKVYSLNSKQRKELHLGAVFVNNFVNACYDIAYTHLQNKNLKWEFLLPLIQQTTKKVEKNIPGDVQTGPARRNDQEIIEEHLQLLKKEKNAMEVYRVMTEYIQSIKQVRD
ncbi:MAG: Rossmann-like and DUF2520 domain-containing protein [Bacteroidota bacterium]